MKRTKKRNRKPSEIVESLRSAASRLGIDLHHVQAAKKAGCSAFRPGGRVHLGELRAYLGSNPVTKASLPPLSDAEIASQAGLEDALRGAVRDEIEIGRDLQNARARGDTAAVADLTLAIGRARKNRLAIEAAVTKLQQARGELIHISTHKLEGFKMWRPIIDCIRRIPRKATLEIAGQIGGDEALVHRILDRAVEDAIGEAKKMLTFPDEEQKQLARTLLLLAITGEDRRFTPETLEHLDSLRAVVVAELAEQGRETPPTGPEKPPVTSEF